MLMLVVVMLVMLVLPMLTLPPIFAVRPSTDGHELHEVTSGKMQQLRELKMWSKLPKSKQAIMGCLEGEILPSGGGGEGEGEGQGGGGGGGGRSGGRSKRQRTANKKYGD